MPKIDKLILRSILSPFLISLTVLTFVVFLGKIGSWSKLFISNDASLEIMATTSLAILPTIMIFSLPLSYLIGILIGISGLNGESQITALRTCGIPVRRLLLPIFSIGAVVGILTTFLTVVAVPNTNTFLTNIKEEIALSQAPARIQARVFNQDLPNRVFYLEDVSADKKEWLSIFMATDTDSTSPDITLARKGTWIGVENASNNRLQLHLEDGAKYSFDFNKPGNDQSTEFKAIEVPIELNTAQYDPINTTDRQRKVSEMGISELWMHANSKDSDENVSALVEINQRISLPFSVFPFSLLGLTLAVRSPKGGRTFGFALSLIVVVLFYILFINGIRLAKIGEINPNLGPWAADILLGCFGILFLFYSDRSSRGFYALSFKPLKKIWRKIDLRLPWQRLQFGLLRLDSKLFQKVLSLFRFLFPKIFDLYISRGFLAYFFWSLVTCSILFILFTLFEFLDDVIRNETPIVIVLEYFTFLIPQILMMAIPMSVLLGILINFGILEKNSEITAIKAGGWSLYRISIPVFLLAGLFSAFLFIIQDYVLPASNERQDRIWNSIKGRPPSTSLMKRKWILGESGRIYNYEHFDEAQDEFVGLNIYETDLDAARIRSIIRASRASISENGAWNLTDGWIRDYREQNGFKEFKTETFYFPEKADYFEREIFQPTESSKMTYYGLMLHINYLMKSGYNAIELQVELMKKLAFPFSCLIMALLAIPFSFIIGNRGAFFGIGVSIAIAIAYFMIMGLFESMGTYGILTPFLAAWAPNILFGAAGCWLLLSTRT